MRIVVMGQAAFGAKVLEELVSRGEEVVGVSCPVSGSATRADPLKEQADRLGLPIIPTASLKRAEGQETFAALQPDLCVMAFVTDIIPEKVLNIPTKGTIQYHPSLLPRHRGGNAIQWAIIMGDSKTGLTIFWPDKGIDTGPILLQREVDIEPDDTTGSLYFNKLFPMGVEALLEAVDMVKGGTAPRVPQDESQATYEPLLNDEHTAIDWAKPAREVYNLIRGCNPQPGAHTTLNGEQLRIFDCELLPSEASAKDAPGTILRVDDRGLLIALNGGQLLIKRVQPAGTAKIAAADYTASHHIRPGQRLGS